MKFIIQKTPEEIGRSAAQKAGELILDAIAKRGTARVMLSTGQSQFQFFEALIAMDLPWDKIEFFHLDEYVGLPVTHIASFRKYLKERFVDKIGPTTFHYVNGEADTDTTIAELSVLLDKAPIDVGLIGIGENAHIAFNDPPADFEAQANYHVVKLADRCRQQQVNEGWFPSVDAVPEYAISATVSCIYRCRNILSVVPHAAKAQAIVSTLSATEKDVNVPATALMDHPAWTIYADAASASRWVESGLQCQFAD